MESNRKSNTWWEYVALLIAYAAIRIHDVWAIGNFVTLIFPLNFLYFAKLLFSGASVNPAIADTIIAPANASLIYPPGIYILSSALGSVRNVFYFLFAIQAVIPLLVFRLLRPITPRLFAFAAAILVVYYCTSASLWYPDFIIQPVMAGILVFILMRDAKMRPLQLVLCGIASGLIVLLKHNIGIFFVVMCGALIFFRSCSFSAEKKNIDPLSYFFIAGFLGFGLVFLTKLPHWDEVVFYLLPYFVFWLHILHLFRKSDLQLDSSGFVKRGALYAFSALILPLIVFLRFGDVIGFKRYWHSLFGMGFEHIGFWDKGIWEIIRAYANFDGFAAGYNSLILLAAIIGPFLINLAGVGMLFKGRAEDNQKKMERIVALSMGIMAVFMLFPLEDHKIAVTKFFVFAYVFLMLLRNASARTWRNLTLAALVMLLPILLSTWRSLQSMTKIPAVAGTPVMQQVIGLPLHKDIAQELDAQMKVLQRATKGEAYFVLASPRYNLMTLPILVDNRRPQYYVRFDAAAMSNDVVRDTISVLEKMPFVAVPIGDYQDYLAGKTEDAAFRELIAYVNRGFVIVDEFAGTKTDAVVTRHIDGFMVLKRK